MKKLSIGTILFFCFGGFLVLTAIFALKNEIIFAMNAEEVVCKIVDIEVTSSTGAKKTTVYHDVYVSYTYNGEHYDRVHAVNHYKSGMYVGQEITSYCNPNYPGIVKKPTTQILAYVGALLFGAVFCFIGHGSYLGDKKKYDLLQNGRTIFATIESIQEDSSFKYNGENTYNLNCVYEEEFSGKIYRFEEKHLTRSQSLKYHVGNKVKVNVQPDDYSNYYIFIKEGELQEK